MAESIKFSPEEVEGVLKKLMSEDQFQKFAKDKDMIMNLCSGYQSPLLEFTSNAKADLVRLITERKEKQLPVDVDSLMKGRTVPEGRTEEDERNRIGRVIASLEAGEDPTKYKAKVRIKLGNPDPAGRQAIIPDMAFPRKELIVASEMKVGDVTIRLDDRQIDELKSVGRMNGPVEGVDSDGVVHKFLVAKDSDLNSLRFLDQTKVAIPMYMYGLKLEDKTREILREGKIAKFEIKAKGDVKTVEGYFDPVTYKIKFLQDAKDQVLRTETTQAQIDKMNLEAGQQKTTKKEKTKPSQALQDMMGESHQKSAAKTEGQKQPQKRKQGQGL